MDRIPLDDGEVFLGSRRVIRAGQQLRLSPREAAVLGHLARASPRTVGVEELLVEVCGLRADTATHTVQTCIYTLRQKLEVVPSAPRLVVRAGRGAYRYVFPTSQTLRTALTSADLLAGIDSEAAARSIETVLRIPDLAPEDIWRLRVQLGSIRQRQGSLIQAHQAMEAGGPGPASTRSSAHVVHGLIAYREGERSAAARHWKDAVREAAGVPAFHATAAFHVGLLRWWEPVVLEEWAHVAAHLRPRAAALVRSAAAQGWLALDQPERALEVSADISGPFLYERRVLLEARALAQLRMGHAEAEVTWSRAQRVDPGAARLVEPYGWGVRAAYLRETGHPAAACATTRITPVCPFTVEVAERLLP